MSVLARAVALLVSFLAVAGGVFYVAAEWTSLRLRDRVAPRRSDA